MNLKIILLTLGITAVMIGGGLWLVSRQPAGQVKLEKSGQVTLKVDHDKWDWGNIDYNSGMATHSFPISNSGSGELKLANVKTSCMCTTAQVVTAAGPSPKFKMHQASDWQGILAPGESGEIRIEYDPTYHGPSGTGPIERIISLETNDPNLPYVEVSVKGMVIKS